MTDPPFSELDEVIIMGNPIVGFRAYVNGIEVDYGCVFTHLEKERLALKKKVEYARNMCLEEL